MLTPTFTPMSVLQWEAMPSDTNRVESLNKCSIDHRNKCKTLESCLEDTYRQDKKMMLEHLYTWPTVASPCHFRGKHWIHTSNELLYRQNKARRRQLVNLEENEDDVAKLNYSANLEGLSA